MPGGTTGIAIGGPATNFVTRKTLRRKLANKIKRDGVLTGIATNDTSVTPNVVQLTSLLVDVNNLKSSKWNKGRFGEASLYRLDTGEEHLVFAYDPAQGTIAPDHNWNTAPTSGVTEYEVHTHGLSVADLHDSLDYATLAAKTDRWMVLPGVMDEITTGSWANSVVTQSTVLESDGYDSQHVQGNGYVYFSAPVRNSTSYSIYATVRVVSGQASIVIYDATNNAPLAWQGDTVVTSQGWTLLSGVVQIPSNCALVQVRLISTVDVFWRDVGFRRVGTPITLPTYVIDPQNQILGPGLVSVSVGSGAFPYGTSQSVGMSLRGNIIEDPGISARIYIHLALPYGPLAYDTDGIPSNAEEWILAGATFHAMRKLVSVPTVSTDPYNILAAQYKLDWNRKNATKQPVNRFGRPAHG